MRFPALADFLSFVRWRQRFNHKTWEQYLNQGLREAAHLERIREVTRSGFPLGDDRFRSELAQRFALKTAAGKPGRPSKPKTEPSPTNPQAVWANGNT